MKKAASQRAVGLFLLFAVCAAGIGLLEWTKAPVERDAAPVMRDAAARMQAALQSLKAERIRRGFLPEAADDPNGTGMIGDMYTMITTSLGSLESKRSTTNPNFAAAVVDMFTELDLRPGDRVAVNLSGSFPCANIAVLCAMDAMGLTGVSIPSVGASTFGATLPGFTYPDMEAYLVEEGLLTRRSTAFSMGGEGDLGLEMPDDLRAEIQARLTGLGYELLSYENIEENIAERVRRFAEGGPVRCFVNVGGNIASFGTGSGMTTAPGGIIASLPDGERGNGLVQHYLREGVPVVHLLYMKGILTDYGLPYDPVPLPQVGEGGVYWREGYQPGLLMAVCALDLLALCAYAWRFGELGRKKRG